MEEAESTANVIVFSVLICEDYVLILLRFDVKNLREVLSIIFGGIFLLKFNEKLFFLLVRQVFEKIKFFPGFQIGFNFNLVLDSDLPITVKPTQ